MIFTILTIMISGLWEKLGFWPKELVKKWRSKRDWIWFHAVSVGEFNAILPLIEEISVKKPSYQIMISCTTKAGYELAKNKTKEKREKEFIVFYFPFDFPWTINSLLKFANVKLLVIAETEIWPNILSICSKRNIPTILASARLSDKSFKNYLLLRFYFKGVINLFTKVLAQSKSDADKFKQLGLQSEKVKILGNIKFANSLKNTTNGAFKRNSDFTTLIFASTHKGEEEIAVSTYKNLINEFTNLKLIIAPRHINRIDEIIEIVKSNGFEPILKTTNKNIHEIKFPKEILVLNTIGELEAYYALSDITVLCGTFAKIGGHNILEPIRANSYTIIGPHDFKIKELSNTFKKKNAILQVKDTKELVSKIKEAVINKEIRKSTIKNGMDIINDNANVLENTVNEILEYL